MFKYVLEGEGELWLDGRRERAIAGDVYILRASKAKPQRYRANPRNPWKKIWITYVADDMPPVLDVYALTTVSTVPKTHRAHG